MAREIEVPFAEITSTVFIDIVKHEVIEVKINNAINIHVKVIIVNGVFNSYEVVGNKSIDMWATLTDLAKESVKSAVHRRYNV